MTYIELGDRDNALAQTRILQSMDKGMYNKLLGEMQK
jgi:hypothetical protein